jgi:hypothetical protein
MNNPDFPDYSSAVFFYAFSAHIFVYFFLPNILFQAFYSAFQIFVIHL